MLFEYKVIWAETTKELEEELNLAAREGWELHSFLPAPDSFYVVVERYHIDKEADGA